MKTAKEHEGWIKVRGAKDIEAHKPNNNDLIWYPGLCRNKKTHPADCHHPPITVKEFRARRKDKNRAKITRVYYCKNSLPAKGLMTNLREQTRQNVAVIANFIVILVIMGYIVLGMNSHTSQKPVTEHKPVASKIEKIKKAKVTVKKTTSVANQH